MLHSLAHEFRLAFRALLRSPGYTTTAVATLALGIGANALAYCFASAIFLRPLPFPHGGELVGISATHRAANGSVVDFAASSIDFFAYTARNRTLTGVGAIDSRTYAIAGPERPETVLGAMVSASMWSVLGTRPVAGRTFDASEDVPGSTVAVISQTLQEHLFPGPAASALGRTVVVDGQPRAVVGVLPAGYRPRLNPGDVWIPMGATDASAIASHQMQLVGRMRAGVTLAMARADIMRVATELATEQPGTHRDWGASVTDLRMKIADSARAVTLTLVAAVGFLFLLTCANVTNLALVRVARRRHEVSTRLALGASRVAIVRNQFIEALLVGIGGGAVGVVIAAVGLQPAQRLLATDNPLLTSVTMDWRVSLLVLALSTGAAVLCCVAPALFGLASVASAALGGGGRRQQSGVKERRVRRGLMTMQVAAATVLLIGAFGALATLRRLGDAEVGFDPDNLFVAGVTLPAARYPTPPSKALFVDQTLARLRAESGVQSAAVTTNRFVRGTSVQTLLNIDGHPPDDLVPAEVRRVDPDYFSVMGLSVVRGRAFTADDRVGSVIVVMVNQTFVRKYLGDREAIGARVKSGTNFNAEIVGVVPDVMDAGVGVDVGPMLYRPYAQAASPSIAFVIRMAPAAASADQALRTAVASIDPTQPVDEVVPITRRLTDSLGENRFKTLLLAVLSGLALVVACVGIYGVTAYLMAERTKELAIRMALGAQSERIIGRFVWDAGRWIVAGSAIGLAIAVWLSSALGRLVPEIGAAGAGTYVTTCTLLIGVGVIAVLIPTIRASRIAPARVLRGE